MIDLTRPLHIKTMFEGIGWSPIQSAALVGNAMQESGVHLKTTIHGDHGSVGLFQWRLNRLSALKEFAHAAGLDWQGDDAQVKFADHELNSSERRWGKNLRRSETLDDAVKAVISFLRPRGWTAKHPEHGDAFATRKHYAELLLNK